MAPHGVFLHRRDVRPAANARYAAKFLRELYDEFGDWSKAAGAFHSRTPKHATSYAARFNKFRDKFRAEDSQVAQLAEAIPQEAVAAPVAYVEQVAAAQPSSDIPEIPPDIVRVANAQQAQATPPRVNRYPLLRTGGSGGLGSLVPPIDRTASAASLFPPSAASKTVID